MNSAISAEKPAWYLSARCSSVGCCIAVMVARWQRRARFSLVRTAERWWGSPQVGRSEQRELTRLERQQGALAVQPAAVAGQRSVRPDHPVARDDDRDRRAADGRADRAGAVR